MAYSVMACLTELQTSASRPSSSYIRLIYEIVFIHVAALDLCLSVRVRSPQSLLAPHRVSDEEVANIAKVRRELLREWYCANDFVVGFDTNMVLYNRSHLERAL